MYQTLDNKIAPWECDGHIVVILVPIPTSSLISQPPSPHTEAASLSAVQPADQAHSAWPTPVPLPTYYIIALPLRVSPWRSEHFNPRPAQLRQKAPETERCC